MKSGADLNGKIVGVQSLNDLDTVATRAWVDQHGGDSRTVRFVELPMAAKAAALETSHRRGDRRPALPRRARERENSRDRRAAQRNRRALHSVDVVRNDGVGEQTCRRREAVRVGSSRPRTPTPTSTTETAPLLAQFSGLPLSVVEQMAPATLGTSLTPADIQPVIDVAVKYQLIAHPFTAQELMGRR